MRLRLLFKIVIVRLVVSQNKLKIFVSLPCKESDKFCPSLKLFSFEMVMTFHPVDLKLAGTTNLLGNRRVKKNQSEI